MPCQTLSGVGSYRKRLVEPEMQPWPQLVGSSIADIGSRNLGSLTKCQEALKPEERTETFAARIRKRDAQGLEEVVRRYLPQILCAARGAGFATQLAEDRKRLSLP